MWVNVIKDGKKYQTQYLQKGKNWICIRNLFFRFFFNFSFFLAYFECIGISFALCLLFTYIFIFFLERISSCRRRTLPQAQQNEHLPRFHFFSLFLSDFGIRICRGEVLWIEFGAFPLNIGQRLIKNAECSESQRRKRVLDKELSEASEREREKERWRWLQKSAFIHLLCSRRCNAGRCYGNCKRGRNTPNNTDTDIVC